MRSATSSAHGRHQLDPVRPRRDDLDRQRRRRPRGEHVTDDVDDRCRRERLADESIGLTANGPQQRLRRVVCRHDDDPRRRGERSRVRQDVEAAHAGQADVEEHHVDAAVREHARSASVPSRCLGDAVAGILAGACRAPGGVPDRRRRQGRDVRVGAVVMVGPPGGGRARASQYYGAAARSGSQFNQGDCSNRHGTVGDRPATPACSAWSSTRRHARWPSPRRWSKPCRGCSSRSARRWAGSTARSGASIASGGVLRCVGTWGTTVARVRRVRRPPASRRCSPRASACPAGSGPQQRVGVDSRRRPRHQLSSRAGRRSRRAARRVRVSDPARRPRSSA